MRISFTQFNTVIRVRKIIYHVQTKKRTDVYRNVRVKIYLIYFLAVTEDTCDEMSAIMPEVVVRRPVYQQDDLHRLSKYSNPQKPREYYIDGGTCLCARFHFCTYNHNSSCNTI